jgi:hypothetical protein
MNSNNQQPKISDPIIVEEFGNSSASLPNHSIMETSPKKVQPRELER